MVFSSLPDGSVDVDAALLEPDLRVDLVAVLVPDLVMQVRAGGIAAVADGGDLIAGLDLLAGLHEALVDMTEDADGAVVLPDPDPLAEAGCGAGFDDGAIGDGVDRGADLVGDVDAVMDDAPACAVAG